jgi:hypothetical protein
MALPLWTTVVNVLRPPVGDPYEVSDTAAVSVATVNAHISSPSGHSNEIGGQQEVVEFRLDCDLCDLRHTDLVRDVTTARTYSVAWVAKRVGLGLDHMTAGLRVVEGAAA